LKGYKISSKDVFRQSIIKALKNKAMTYQELYITLCKNGLCNTSLYYYLSVLTSEKKITKQTRTSGEVGRPQVEYVLIQNEL
jgi:response regulator of citrate/malate metabolism